MEIGEDGYEYWHLNDIRPEDAQITKKRYSAFIQGSSDVERHLRDRGIDTAIDHRHRHQCVLRKLGARRHDAQLQGRHGVRRAAPRHTDEEHNATLSAFYGQFGDVQTVDEVLQSLERGDKKKTRRVATLAKISVIWSRLLQSGDST